MSAYIEDMDNVERQIFKHWKREFKHGKPCAICGNKFKSHQMTVDHIVRVADGSDIYDQNNWQVLCKDCHNKKSAAESEGEVWDYGV